MDDIDLAQEIEYDDSLFDRDMIDQVSLLNQTNL